MKRTDPRRNIRVVSTRSQRESMIQKGEVDSQYSILAVEVPPTAEQRIGILDGTISKNAKFYRSGACSVILERVGMVYHLAVSHPRRYPRWDEIIGARYGVGLDEEITMVLFLPGKGPAVGARTMHLWQINMKKPSPILKP